MNRAPSPVDRMTAILGMLALAALLVLGVMYTLWLPNFLGHSVGP